MRDVSGLSIETTETFPRSLHEDELGGGGQTAEVQESNENDKERHSEAEERSFNIKNELKEL